MRSEARRKIRDKVRPCTWPRAGTACIWSGKEMIQSSSVQGMSFGSHERLAPAGACRRDQCRLVTTSEEAMPWRKVEVLLDARHPRGCYVTAILWARSRRALRPTTMPPAVTPGPRLLRPRRRPSLPCTNRTYATVLPRLPRRRGSRGVRVLFDRGKPRIFGGSTGRALPKQIFIS